MALMILGLGLWWASHLFPIYMAERRAAMLKRLGGKLYKSGFAMFSVFAVVAMVMGYRQAGFVTVWTPPGWTIHINNLLMLLALFLMDAGKFNSNARHYIRHPMLTAVKIWAVAHLLVNGDLASIVLFGGVLGWAVVAMIGSNRRDGAWERPAKGSMVGLARHGVFTVVVFLAIVAIHGPLLGVYPFPR
ncbi:MAG: NnrU family protein [Alphaproteobacteria bacterium]